MRYSFAFVTFAIAGLMSCNHCAEDVSSGFIVYSESPEYPEYSETLVYRDDDVVFRQIDGHTWEGNGKLCYNESVYVVEGEDSALLIDAGTRIPNLDKIVAGITSKPVTLVATHVHPDHTGSSISLFDEIWINAADMVNVKRIMKDYEGEIRYLADGQVFDLGGRQIEVIFTPGHTPGSTTFFDKEAGYGFSGDAFGSTNLLLSTNFSTLICTTGRIAEYMEKNGIAKLYPGHYHGDNPETLQRVKDLKTMSEEVLAGVRTGEADKGSRNGLNTYVTDFGVTIRYNTPAGLK